MIRNLVLLLGAGFLLGTPLVRAADEKPKQDAKEEKRKRPQERPKGGDTTRLLEQFDKNKDGFIDRAEAPENMKQRFDRIDTNSDGKLSKEELQRVAGRLGSKPSTAAGPEALFRLVDTNSDGKLSKEELQNAVKILEKLDKNKDGVLDREELNPPAQRKRPRQPDQVSTLVRDVAREALANTAPRK